MKYIPKQKHTINIGVKFTETGLKTLKDAMKKYGATNKSDFIRYAIERMAEITTQ